MSNFRLPGLRRKMEKQISISSRYCTALGFWQERKGMLQVGGKAECQSRGVPSGTLILERLNTSQEKETVVFTQRGKRLENNAKAFIV